MIPIEIKELVRRAGAPSKMTPEVIGSLKEAFAMDCSIREACLYAGINTDTYYEWMKQYPKLSDQFNILRESPVLMARNEVIKGLKGDKRFSFDYLKSKRSEEFSTGGGIKVNVGIAQFNEARTPRMLELAKEYEDKYIEAVDAAWDETEKKELKQ